MGGVLENTKVKYVSPYTPQSNPAECVMTSLGSMIRIFCRENHRRWPAILNDIEAKLNSVEHGSTGTIPYVLMGKEVRLDEALSRFQTQVYRNINTKLNMAVENFKKAAEYRRSKFRVPSLGYR